MGYNVLIVDDSPSMRKLIRRVVSLSGLEVHGFTEAEDGMDALEKLRAGNIQLVLTDINMPRMNGEELLRFLRIHPRLRRLPVLVISSDASEERVSRMIALGAKGYVTKPFTPEALGQSIEGCLAGGAV